MQTSGLTDARDGSERHSAVLPASLKLFGSTSYLGAVSEFHILLGCYCFFRNVGKFL